MPEHPPLPEGCALGLPMALPFTLGVPAVEAPTNPVMSLVAADNADGILDLGRRGLYEGMRREVTTLTDRFEGETRAVSMRITGATPLHLAVQLCLPDVVAALVLLDPDLVLSRGTVTFDTERRRGTLRRSTIRQSTPEYRQTSAAEMASLYFQKKGSEYETVWELMRNWVPMVEDGFFSGDTSISSRINDFGFEYEKVVNSMISLAHEDWTRTVFSLVEEDSFSLLFRVASLPDMGTAWVNMTNTSMISAPFQLLPLFDFTDRSETLFVCDMNPLHKALVLGHYKAACALLVICPEFVSKKIKIMDDLDAALHFEALPSMIVKLFHCNQDLEARQTCFRILSMAEKQAGLFEPLGLPTIAERIEAAGKDPSMLMSKWRDVALGVPTPALWSARLNHKRKRGMMTRFECE